jgi:hypothetical protein
MCFLPALARSYAIEANFVINCGRSKDRDENAPSTQFSALIGWLSMLS